MIVQIADVTMRAAVYVITAARRICKYAAAVDLVFSICAMSLLMECS